MVNPQKHLANFEDGAMLMAFWVVVEPTNLKNMLLVKLDHLPNLWTKK